MIMLHNGKTSYYREYFKSLRKAMSLTQIDIANAIGASQSAISGFENGSGSKNLEENIASYLLSFYENLDDQRKRVVDYIVDFNTKS